MKKAYHTMGILILIVVIGIGCTGCIQQKSESGTSPYMDDFFRGEFSVKGEPALNQDVTVTLTVTPIEDSFNTEILIHLPEGVELIEGDTYWEGNIKKDEPFQMRIIVKPIEEGQLKIWTEVIGDVAGAERNWVYCIFFLTSKEKGEVSRTAFYYEPPPVGGEMIKIPVTFSMKSRSVLHPTVGEEVVLVLELYASEDTPNVQAEIVIPEEFIYISGPLEWSGDLKKDQKETFQVKIKTTKRGRFSIKAVVIYDDEKSTFIYDIFVW
jgi:hypothetical protein